MLTADCWLLLPLLLLLLAAAGKTPEQIRETFRLPDDLTEEEKLEPLRTMTGEREQRCSCVGVLLLLCRGCTAVQGVLPLISQVSRSSYQREELRLALA